jgi:sugar lactone lactonase YvrE
MCHDGGSRTTLPHAGGSDEEVEYMSRRFAALAMAGALAVVLAVPAAAQDESASPGAWTTVVEGLDSPRGLTIGPDGTLYVAESGEGGDTCMTTPLGEGCMGLTGGVSAIEDGVATRVVDGLPSARMGEGPEMEISGPSSVAIAEDGSFILPIWLGPGGLELRASLPEELGQYLGWLISVAPDGTITPIADLAQWEADNNPDADDPGSAVDSNPYAVAIAPDGTYLVADAGGNDILMVAADGTITLGALFHATMMPAPPDPTASADPGASPAMVPMQAVPTSVVIGPDGAAYVGELTGFPFPVGGASVWRVEPGSEPTRFAEGFTNVIGIAFGPDDTLWVAEIFHNSILSGDPTGGLWSVAPDGDPTLVATDGLMLSGGVAVADDGTVHVSNGAVIPNGGSIVSMTP